MADNFIAKFTNSNNVLFYRLAENRVRSKNFGAFSTNLRQEDVDDSVRDYLDGGQKSLEAFSRIESDDDLSNL